MPDTEIVGRDRELQAISSFLEESAHPGVLLIQGDAGIGKTTLWRWGVERAMEQGWCVLTAGPAASEARLAFAAIGDLLGGAVDPVLPRLPPPQRRALEVALLLGEARKRPPDERTIAVAVLGALRALARERPLLVALDDVQWLDPPSANLLSFSVRRLGDDPVGLLLVQRAHEASGAPLGLDRAFGERLSHVRPRPLSLGATHRMLRSHLGLTLPRPAIHRLHSACNGNPLFALEIGRILKERGPDQPRADEPLPVPRDMEQLVAQRIKRLTPPGREAVLAAALQGQPAGEVLEQAADEAGLEEAVAAGILVEEDGLRFAHPLFAEAVTSLMPGSRRRQMHLRLAMLLADPEVQAQHLALGSSEPAAEVAAAIDAGAAAAAARGAPSVAAQLAEAAAGLTPPDAASDELRRRLAAAEWHLTAGDITAARSLLEPIATATPSGPQRARVLMRLAETKEPAAVLPVLEQALEEAAGDIELLAEVHFQLAWVLLSTHGATADLAAAIRATELAEAAGNRRLLVAARGVRLLLETAVGIPVDPDVVASLIGEYDPYGPGYPPAVSAALWLMYRDRLDESRAALAGVARQAMARGDEITAMYAFFHLAELECRAGRYETAAEHAEEALAIELTGLDQSLSAALYTSALAHAYLGRVEEARAAADRGLELARSVGDKIFDIQNEAVLGFLDLSVGEARAAATRLAPLWPRLVELGYGEPSVFPVLPNAIHALLELGDREQAEHLLDQLEERGQALDSPWALSQAARLRAVVAAEAGRTDDALALIDEALALHQRMPGPFERGRTLLVEGVVLRRARRKRDARAALREALAIFEELGTPLWAAKAQAEIARIGGRAATGDLTATERRVAELVAQGRSNKDVAAQLFITPRTVEGHLTRIYAKLGIRSRAELAHRMSVPAG